MSDCPRKPNEVRIMGRLFGCVGMQAASKSEHCSDSTLLNRNLFGLGEGTQVNPNIVQIAPPPNRNLFSLHEGTQVNPNIVWIAPRLTEICSFWPNFGLAGFGLARFGLARFYCIDQFSKIVTNIDHRSIICMHHKFIASKYWVHVIRINIKKPRS